MKTTQVTAPKLKSAWTPSEFKTVERAIVAYFNRSYVTTMHNVPLWNCKTFGQYSDALGFAYTSSSSFAMYSICNTEAYFDFGKHWHFVCFGLSDEGSGKSGFVYALLHDAEENEIYFPIN